MASTIKLKTSTSSGNVPASLAKGEIAINVADGVWYYGGASAVQQNFKFGSLTVSGDTSLGALTVGVNGTGQYVKFFGDTSGQYMLWDQSADKLIVTGEIEATKFDGALEGNADTATKIDSITNTDIVQLDDTQTLTNKTLTTPTITSISNSGTVTIPTGADTLVARTSTDTLTNKTLTAPTFTDPVLGQPDSGDLTNCTGYPAAQLPSSIDATKIADGTVTNTEFQFINTLASNAQTQINAKQATITTNSIAWDKMVNLTASRALYSDASGDVTVSNVTSTELGYLDGVSSSIQTQMNLKAALISPRFVTPAIMPAAGEVLNPRFVTIVASTDQEASGIVLTIPSITENDTFVVVGGAQTLTGTKTLNSFKGTGSVTVTDIKDTDNFSDASATSLATSESIKAYVDSKDHDANTLQEVTTAGATSNVAITLSNDLTVGTNGTGHDVKFFGDTSGAYMLWDQSADDLIIAGAGGLSVDGVTNLDNTDIDGTLVVDGTNISLDSTNTLNIDNSNTSLGITIGTATSGVPIILGNTSSSNVRINDNLTVTGNTVLNGTLSASSVNVGNGDGSVSAATITVSSNMIASNYNSTTSTNGYQLNGTKFLWRDGGDHLQVGNTSEDTDIIGISINLQTATTVNDNFTVTNDTSLDGNLTVTGNTVLNGTLSAVTSITTSGDVLAGTGVDDGVISAGTVNGAYQLICFNGNAGALSDDNWQYPGTNGISNSSWGYSSDGSGITTGSSTFSVIRTKQMSGIVLPAGTRIVGITGALRSSTDDTAYAGLFTYSPNYGSSDTVQATLRILAQSVDNSGGSAVTSDAQFFKGDAAFASQYVVQEGDQILPAFRRNSSSSQTVIGSFTIIVKY